MYDSFKIINSGPEKKWNVMKELIGKTRKSKPDLQENFYLLKMRYIVKKK